ncbi:MAG: S9 family peptidase [Bacteroidetes bacterium]|nr:S9 family peptidase [Bacteroidota bacterium]
MSHIHHSTASCQMKYFLALLIFICTLPGGAQVLPGDNLEVSGIPPIPMHVVERTKQYQDVRSASCLGWDRDGGMYIATRFANTTQVHHVAAPGAARRQLTFFDEPVSGASPDPRPARSGFVFSRDVGGGEFYQLFYFDRTSGHSRLLTDGESRNTGRRWSNDGSAIAFSSNRRNGKDMDVWILPPDAPEEARRLTEREGSWSAREWSPDDKRMVVTRYISANESRPYLLTLETGEMVPLYEKDRPVSYGGFEWTPDGRTLFYTSDESDEFRQLHAYEVATGRRLCITPALQWNIEGLSLSDDGRHLAYTTNEHGLSVLHLFRLPDYVPVRHDPLPTGRIGGLRFSPDGTQLALNINTVDSPTDVWTIDPGSGTLEQWTFSEVGGLNTEHFVTPRLIHYPTFDLEDDGSQRMIPAFVFLPDNATGPVPVIISIHGGPEGQSRPGFSSTIHYWVQELGCAVILPNVRGSSGYGKTWLALDNAYNREHSVRDIGALLDWIDAEKALDGQRVAVFGGSYGGYMVLASLVHYPERIACGVNIVGISNFVTFLEHTQDYRRDLRRAEYGDERDAEMRAFLTSISPLTNAHRIRAPLFVAQGENDPRVPASEARQIVRAVEQQDIPVWTMFASDEGHGFAKKANRDYFTWATILFFEQYLLR